MPTMKLCPNNHYYDSDRYSECPYCKERSGENPPPSKGNLRSGRVEETVPVDENDYTNSFQSSNNNYARGKTRGMYDFSSAKTKGMYGGNETQSGISAYQRVVGWLVCTNGNDCGRDFRIHVDNNFVGRNDSCDIVIRDPYVSAQHFTVTYDPLNDIYIASMSGGRAIVYINGQPLTSNHILQKGDKLKVGQTELVFIPLESSYVKWNWTPPSN